MTLLYIEENQHPSLRRAHLKCDDNSSEKCLNEWSTRHLYYNVEKSNHACRNCIRKRYASTAGKVAGRRAVESGQIKQFIQAAASPESRSKAQATSRAKGRRAFSSKVEDAVHAKCLEWFGEVRRWVYITRNDGKRASVDMFIPSISTYVEVDGSYWHGLDKPYEQLGDDQRKKFDNDRRLDEHCKQHGIRLVRIIDSEVFIGDWVAIQKRIMP